MKPTLFLRIASVLTLIHSVLHTIGGVFSKPDPGPAAVAYRAMQGNQFLLMGHVRSYADFYRGLGLGVTICLTFEAIVFWQLGALAKTHARPVSYTHLSVHSNLAKSLAGSRQELTRRLPAHRPRSWMMECPEPLR